MNKKTLSFILSALLLLNIAFPFMAFAKSPVTVFDGEETHIFYTDSKDITQTLKNAFSYCASYEGKSFTVSVPKGEYTVSSPITLCDNTALDLSDGVVLVNGKNNSNIFISKKNVTKYNGLKNFSLIGGTLTYSDNYAGSSCQVRIAHGKNISFTNTVFEKNYNSHNVEIAACSNVSFEGCTFKDGTGSLENNSGEALQIDILEETKHFKSMPEYDGTMNSSIKVNNCTFSNVLRGIGTNCAFAGLYHKKIKITNCKFYNVVSTAISCINYIDSTIKENTISNCGEGIRYYLMMSDNNLSKMNYIEGRGTPVSDCNSVISSNSINVVKTSGVSSAVGIHIFGNIITKSKKTPFKTGDYYVGNITVKKNKIKTENNGIRLFDVKNSRITNNTVIGNNKNSGITLNDNSKSNRLYNNSVKGFENGIYIANSNGDVLKSNILENNGFGIYFSSEIKAYTHKNFFNSNSKGNCFSAGETKSYKFSNLSEPEIKVTKFSKTATIRWKKIKHSKYYQIYRSTSNNGEYKKIATVKDARTYKDKKLKKGKTYYYKVRARRKLNNVYNYSEFSTIKSIKI